jgi:hypothetical protein
MARSLPREEHLRVEQSADAAAGAAHAKGEEMNLGSFGLRGLLLILATILFIVAALNNENATDLISVGLAVFAAAFVVDDTGFGRMWGSRRTT